MPEPTTSPHSLVNVLVANPTVTKAEDGTLTYDWPESWPDVCLMSRDLFVEMVARFNGERAV